MVRTASVASYEKRDEIQLVPMIRPAPPRALDRSYIKMGSLVNEWFDRLIDTYGIRNGEFTHSVEPRRPTND